MNRSTVRVHLLLVGVVALSLAAPGVAYPTQHEHHKKPEPAATAARAAESAARGPAAVSRRIEQEGLAIEMTLAPLTDAKLQSGAVLAGQDVELRLSFANAGTGEPVPDLFMATWIDHRSGGDPTTRDACREKVQSYMRGTLQFRPTLDLNSHFIVSLNEGNSLSVLDPLLGFSVSNVYAGVALRAAPEDWAHDPRGQRIFVTLPKVNTVAVVSTATWKVETNLEVGFRPTRIVLSPDGATVWVADDGPAGAASGVTAIDAVAAAVLGHVPTGAGPHAIAFSPDARYVFVTNGEAGTLSVVDASTRTAVKAIPTGARPVALAFSPASGAVYVADERDGTITVVNAATHEVETRLETKPGLRTLAFDPSGRWGFAVNAAENRIYVVDAAEGRIRRSFAFGQAPDQVAFTEGFAYVRSTGTPDVAMIRLAELAEDGDMKLMTFPTGQLAPDQAQDLGTAAAIAPASHHHMSDAVYVASPADQSIYSYHYMMAMPMPGGRLNTFPFRPKAILVVSRSLRETAPGVHTTTLRVPTGGEYDLLLLLDEPRVIHCFDFTASEPQGFRSREPVSLRVEPILKAGMLAAGERVALRFRIVEVATGAPKADVADLEVFVATPTGWSDRRPAKHVGDGVYEVEITLPEPGFYQMVVASRALQVRFEDQVPATLRAAAKPSGRDGTR